MLRDSNSKGSREAPDESSSVHCSPEAFAWTRCDDGGATLQGIWWPYSLQAWPLIPGRLMAFQDACIWQHAGMAVFHHVDRLSASLSDELQPLIA